MNRPLFRATIFGAKARTVLAVPLLILSNANGGQNSHWSSQPMLR